MSMPKPIPDDGQDADALAERTNCRTYHGRAAVAKLLKTERIATSPNGGDRKSDHRSATTVTDSGKTADGILSRLKRDDPDLAQQV